MPPPMHCPIPRPTRAAPHDDTRRQLMTAEVASTSKRVLLVEDEPGLVLTLTDRLKSEGYDVQRRRRTGPSGLERATRERWDVILLDVMLPGASGFDVCRDLRQRGVTTPVIMLTARGQVVDKVLGLKLGADDYLTKPFDMIELLARIEVQLRRARRGRVDDARRSISSATSRVDFRKAEVTRARPLARALGARVPAAQVLHRAPRGDALTRRAAQRGLGLSLDALDAHGGRARRLAASEDRAEPAAPAVPADHPRAWATSSSGNR